MMHRLNERLSTVPYSPAEALRRGASFESMAAAVE